MWDELQLRWHPWDPVLLRASAACSYYRALQGAGNGLGFVYFSAQKCKREAALITNFREKRWSSHPALLVATMCEALGVQHTRVPDVPQLFSFSNAPALSHCLPRHPAAHKHLFTGLCCAGRWLRDITLPANLANVLLEAWEPGERHKEWLRGGVLPMSVLRLFKESPAKVPAKTDLI